MKMEKRLLLIGALMPIIYFTIVVIAGLLNPEFSHIREAGSELGRIGAPYIWKEAYNIALAVAGFLGVLGGLGLFYGLQKIGFGKVFMILASLTVIMPSINLMLSGINPLPHPYHSFLEIIFPAFFAPLFAALIAKRLIGSIAIVNILMIGFVANIIIFAGIPGFGNYVAEDYLGLWLRIWSIITMLSMGYMCWIVRERL